MSAVGGKHAWAFALIVSVAIAVLMVNEVYQERIRQEEKQRTELLAAIVRRGFTVVDDEKGLVQ